MYGFVILKVDGGTCMSIQTRLSEIPFTVFFILYWLPRPLGLLFQMIELIYFFAGLWCFARWCTASPYCWMPLLQPYRERGINFWQSGQILWLVIAYCDAIMFCFKINVLCTTKRFLHSCMTVKFVLTSCVHIMCRVEKRHSG